MARSTNEDLYFNAPRVNEAFRRMPNYEIRTGNTHARPSKFLTGAHYLGRPGSAKIKELLARIRDEVYQRGEPAESVNQRVGIWGQVWAIGVLWSLVAREGGRDAYGRVQLTRSVIGFGQSYNLLPAPPPQHELLELGATECDAARIDKNDLPTTVGSTLYGLLMIGDVSEAVRKDFACGGGGPKINSLTPGIKLSISARRVFAEFVYHHLKQSKEFTPWESRNAKTLCDFLDNSCFASPKLCFEGIAEHLGLTEKVALREVAEETVPEQTGPSWIEPSIWKYVKNSAQGSFVRSVDAFDAIIDSTIDTLDYHGQPIGSRRPAVVLKGPAHSGKKAIVGDMLRRFDALGEITFTCRGRKGVEKVLPILCVQTTSRDYVSLCVETLTFLERINERFKSSEGLDVRIRKRLAEMSRVGTEPNLGVILDRIRELHRENPALFVFLDVGRSPGDINKLFRRTGYERLLTTLLESNEHSRFVLTTSGGLSLANKNARKINVPRPTGRRLKWYLDLAAQDRFVAACDRYGAEDVLELELDGDVLTALAVVLAETPDPELEGFLKLMGECSRAQGAGAGLRLACEQLVAQWGAGAMLPLVALLVTSADGMMLPTVATCLEQWRHSRREEDAPKIPSSADAISLLQSMVTAASGQFLRKRPMAPHFAEEARFDELRRIEAGDTEAFSTYILLHDVAVVLRTLLLENAEGRILLREAYRLVARQAHLRARHMQMKGSEASRSPMERPPERAIQAFTALLLSIDCISDAALNAVSEPGQRLKTEWPSLSHQGDIVFSLDRPVFDPVLAIRFAFAVLLQSEADRDHRLSMSIDADIHRLALYARLCVEPGLREGWYLGRDDLVPSEGGKRDLGALPGGFGPAPPRHFALFNRIERATILESLGMSAFFVGHRPLLVWAENQLWHEWQRPSDAIAPDSTDGDAALAAALKRIVCARVDLEVQIGHPLRGGSIKSMAQNGEIRDQEVLTFGLIDRKRSLKYALKRLDRDIAAIQAGPTGGQTGSRSSLVVPLELELRRLRLRWLLEGPASLGNGLASLDEADREIWSGHSPIRHGRSGRILMTLLLDGYPILRPAANDPDDLWMTHRNRYLAFVQANTARLYRFSGAERLLTVTDHALALAMDREFENALRAITEARRMCQNGNATGRTRLGVLQAEIAIVLAAFEDVAVHGGPIPAYLEAKEEPINRSLEEGELICNRYDLRIEGIRMALLRLRAVEAFGAVGARTNAVSKPLLHQKIGEACKETAVTGLLRFV
ncbi:hypothetical protein [Pararhodobacter zhoushanensis]|uniref:ATP-binding protein n=1 Tax=Pararhodobacter zhoushanensis TaxID=2479545 RepID=A0ABT3GXQ2_9RHOB|nr:hypothetical protein [Pararhodobacter zhoushanensis]MCW1932301.1 hypothetical protein [Pararhodobacter zhoushanensis]